MTNFGEGTKSILIVGPLLLLGFLAAVCLRTYTGADVMGSLGLGATKGVTSFVSLGSARGSSSLDQNCTTCPDMITSLNCGDLSIPVLGGVDIMQYWTDFKIDGSEDEYDETQMGQLGNPSYKVVYNNFQFNFISAENQKLFESDPSAYAPQFGGFCAWGVGGEYCQDGYPWAADCLGPSGNWGHWTIYGGKLYFFYKDEAKDKFMTDPALYAASGEQRWTEWFGDQEDASGAYSGYYSTKCFVDSTANGSSE